MTGKEAVEELRERAVAASDAPIRSIVSTAPQDPAHDDYDRLSDAIAALIDAAILHQSASSHRGSPLGLALARCEAEMKPAESREE